MNQPETMKGVLFSILIFQFAAELRAQNVATITIEIVRKNAVARVAVEIRGGDTAYNEKVKTKLLNAMTRVYPAKKGVYIVKAQYILDNDGYASDVRPLTTAGYGMEQAAVSEIKKGSGPWRPAARMVGRGGSGNR